jgi:hypothetical protein
MTRNLTIATVIVLGSLMGCNKATQPAPATPAQSEQQPATTAATPATTAPAANPPAATPAGKTASAPANAMRERATTPPPEPVKPVVIPAGTTISVRLGQALGSKTSTTGQSFAATVANSVSVDGKVAIPASSSATGSVVAAKSLGKIQGAGELDLTLTELTIKGRAYPITTSVSKQTIKGKGKRSAIATGGGAAGGALLGGLIGGGKGAAIGAGVGAGAGFAGGTYTGNKQIELPAETVVSFQLRQPLALK